jgi:hypothetical protein
MHLISSSTIGVPVFCALTPVLARWTMDTSPSNAVEAQHDVGNNNALRGSYTLWQAPPRARGGAPAFTLATRVRHSPEFRTCVLSPHP